MNDLDTLIKLAEQQARNVLLLLRKPLMPTWVIIDNDGKPHIVATPWKNDHEKRLGELAMRLEMRRLKAKAYSFVTEAWLAMAPKDWDPNTPLPETDRPMNRADRQEAVIACATDGDRYEWRRWIIRRDWNEQVIALELAPIDEFGAPQGWMAEMLK